MKILFFQPPVIAGGSKCLSELAKCLEIKGHEVYVVVCGEEDEAFRVEFAELKSEIIFLNMYPWTIPYFQRKNLIVHLKSRIKFLLNDLVYSKAITDLLLRIKPDIVYCNSFDEYLPIKYAMKRNIPTVIHFHEFGILDHNKWFASSKMARKYLNRTSIKIGISKAIIEFYKSKFPSLDIHLVYDGIDPQIENPSCEYVHKIVNVGIVGRITEGKNQLFVINNAKQFPDINFHFIGDTNNYEYYQECIEKSKGLKNIYFDGYVSKVSDIYNKLDAIIAPSKSEAFGRIIIEAMINKKIVIASNAGAFSELIEDGHDGFLFNLDNQSFCEKLRLILNSDIYPVSKNAYYKAKNGFTAEKNADLIERLLRKYEI